MRNTMSKKNVRYFVFDAESIADGHLVAQIRYPGEELEPIAAIDRYRGELMEKYETEFIPYTFQIPISIAIAKVNSEFELLDLVTLDEPKYRPHMITENFWRGWHGYGKPTLVTFNGRSFDIPLLELAAFRFGISVPDWFNVQAKSWDQYRNRYNMAAHLDLQEVLTNFGASRLNGGLNLVANLLGKPGKMETQGHMVQEMFDNGQLREINDYCRCDVLDTYFVFLRTAVLQGQLEIEQEQALVEQTRDWLAARTEEFPVYARYLDRWNNWSNPWKSDDLENQGGTEQTGD